MTTNPSTRPSTHLILSTTSVLLRSLRNVLACLVRLVRPIFRGPSFSASTALIIRRPSPDKTERQIHCYHRSPCRLPPPEHRLDRTPFLICLPSEITHTPLLPIFTAGTSLRRRKT
ncbi:uncharacterized protein K489DRAFT_159492 [Dissoconium aciculare CBS 342.82]|uniref:Uncharacterized protein n=1 Tax=Dissoconium aciculare CBS 342.82 TaxID=1314786 RepID=A0A6J3MF56_9PEZI|nr:uncharacterized protein K489DRAFT_159492 [Dissoconium aciculare CBS 342.82]KAF1825502.1 hypothetical protein K489DRAFT_159492 [Dissoconium aciculare CBS 342.82]